LKVIKRSAHGYAQDPTKNLGFEDYDGQGPDDIALIIAAFDQSAGCWDQFKMPTAELDAIKKMRVVRLEFEEPNKFFIPEDFDAYDRDFYKVLTLCPFTAEYFNERQAAERRVPIFFPFNENFIPPKCEKQYDIIYTGHLHPKPIMRDMMTISQYNYRLVSNSGHELVTDRGVSYKEKLNLISQSKITLTHNLLYPTVRHVLNVWKYKEWASNKAFADIPTGFMGLAKRLLIGPEIEVPQLKSRIFEAAFCRSLILCKKDNFKVIENYFMPGEEFVYYEEGKLVETINKILSNYDAYLSVIESAYNRAVKQYTTNAFFEKYLKVI
jgi:spore maturation protein CgeB